MIEYKSRRDSMMPSLLPFMAVLLCTMGALVLILILIVSDTKGGIIRERKENLDKIAETSDDVQFVSGELEAVRIKQQSELDRGRRQLAFLEDHITRLHDEAAVLAATAKQIESELLNDKTKETQKPSIKALEDEISKLEKQLDEQSKEDSNKPPAFAIVPYSGPNGTSRRPIYLECVASGVIVQPEGFLVDMEALKPPYGPGNPLDAVLRLLRSEYEKLDNNFSGVSAPYPLLLVRPDGIKTYAYARSAMGGWDDHFGYELIGSDLRLAFPPSQPGTREKIQTTVAAAKERQIALLAAMPRAFRDSQSWDEDTFENDETQDRTDNIGQIANKRSGISSSTTWEMIEELPAGAMNQMNKSPGGMGKIQMSQTPRSARQSESLDGESPGENEEEKGSDVPFDEVGRSYAGMFGGEAPIGGSVDGNDSSGQGPPNGSGNANTQSRSETATDSLNQNAANQNSGLSRSSGDSVQSISMSNYNGSNNVGSAPGSNDPLADTTHSPTPFASPKQSTSLASTSNEPRNPSKNLAKVNSGQKPNAGSSSKMSGNAKDKQKSSDSNSSSNSVGGQWRNLRSRQNQTPVVREIHIHVLPDRWLVADDLDLNRVDAAISLNEGPSAAGNKLSGIVDERINLWGQAIADGYWMPKVITHVYSDTGSSMERLAWILKRLNLEFENSEAVYPLPK